MSLLRQYTPHLIVGLSISLIMIGAYASVGFASLTNPKAVWSVNPITISGGTGHATDSFKCAPAIGSVVLTVSNPLLLTVSPSTFTACGPSFNTITLTAHSATSATVTVTIHRTSQYGNTILPSLTVNTVV